MRRPIVLVCISTALGILVSQKIAEGIRRPAIFLVFAVLLFILSLFTVIYNKRFAKIAGIAGLSFIFGVLSMFAASNSHGNLYYNVGDTVNLTGVVIESEETKPDEKYKLLVKANDGSRILLTVYDTIEGLKHYELVGRQVNVSCEIELPSGKRNPNCFDYRLYLKSKKIETVASVSSDEVLVEDVAEGFYYKYLNKVSVYKGRFGESLESRCGAAKSGIICAMLFGDKELIDEDMYEMFQENGTAHVLSVSGLHVGAVYAAFASALGGKRRKSTSIAASMLLVIYAAMASFAPSVVRAVSMIMIHIFSQLLNRRYDMLCAASLCMLAAFMTNPYTLFNVGFQLSYIAVISISVIGGAFKKYLGMGNILPLVAVNLGMMPVTAYVFNYFSLGSFVANVPVIMLTGLIVPFGMLLMIILPLADYVTEIAGDGMLTILTDVVADIFVRIPTLLSDALICINEITYAKGVFTFDVVSPSVFAMVMYYGFVFGVCSEQFIVWFRRRKWSLLITLLVLLILFAGFLVTAFETGFEDADFVFVDVGQGDCLHIRSANGGNYLVDGGGSTLYDVADNTLKPYLLKNGVRRVDIAFVTHLHTDHYEGIKMLCRDGMVDKLCIYEGNRINEEKILAETNMKREDIIYIKEGYKAELGDIAVEVMSPPEHTNDEYEKIDVAGDENEFSLILKIVQGNMAILMTGDIDAEGERELVEQHGDALKCTILKAAHHGSRFSSCDEFINAACPDVMMFQVGKNNYGHPNKSLIEKCAQKGIMVYRNDEDGAVGIKNDGRGFSVTTVK